MFNHIDAQNNPKMVDVSGKETTWRLATAQARVKLPDEVLRNFDGKDIKSKKGPVFHTAVIAGTMAVKRTFELIPFCHPLPIDACEVHIELLPGQGVMIKCTVKIEGKTGVEMEALTGASVAALAIYDMCKALTHEIEISDIYLLNKSGGKNDFQRV